MLSDLATSKHFSSIVMALSGIALLFSIWFAVSNVYKISVFANLILMGVLFVLSVLYGERYFSATSSGERRVTATCAILYFLTGCLWLSKAVAVYQ